MHKEIKNAALDEIGMYVELTLLQLRVIKMGVCVCTHAHTQASQIPLLIIFNPLENYCHFRSFLGWHIGHSSTLWRETRQLYQVHRFWKTQP